MCFEKLVAPFLSLSVLLRTFLGVQGPDAGRSTEIHGAPLGHGKAGIQPRMSAAVVAGQSRRAQVNEAGEEVAPPLVCRRG